MARFAFIICFLLFFHFSLFCQWPTSDIVEGYTETKAGITITTVVSLRDSAGRRILDAFLNHLSKKLKRSNQNFKILILVDYKTRVWNAAIGVDTARFNYNAMVDYYYPPRKEDTVVEVVLQKVDPQKIPIDTPKQTPAPNWNISYDKTVNDLGLKILYKLPLSDTNIFFDRIYSLTQFGIDHLKEIKKEQTKMEMQYDGYPLSVLTIDTTEIKKTPLISSEFDPNNISTDTKDKSLNLIVPSIIVLAIIFFFLFRKLRSTSTKTL